MSEKEPSSAELEDLQAVDPWTSSELAVKSRGLPHLTVAGAIVATGFSL